MISSRRYYAAMSYTDAQVGKVLDKMEELGFHNDTIIVLWGDHGWQLVSILKGGLRITGGGGSWPSK